MTSNFYELLEKIAEEMVTKQPANKDDFLKILQSNLYPYSWQPKDKFVSNL